MSEDKAIIELAPILNLPPVNKAQLVPHALARYLRLIKEIYDEVPVDKLCEEDLTEEEKIERKRTTEKIVGWIGMCGKNSSSAALMVYPYSGIISDNIMDLKKILKTAYERKLDKQRHQARKETRMKALHDVNPPVDDAEKYLTEDEQESFAHSVPGAVDAYLDGGKGCPLNDWRLDRRAHDYMMWLWTMKQRKEKEALAKQAEKDFQRYVKDINKAIEKLKEELAKEKKPSYAYAQSLTKYSPGRWCELDEPSTHEVEAWAVPHMWERVPSIIKHLVSWHLTWWLLWLPRARYELLGVPSLVWCYQAKVLAEIELTISERTFTKNFSGCDCNIEVQAQDLGSFYLGPVEWGDERVGFSVPIALLTMFSTGTLEDDGIEIIHTEGNKIGFLVRGYDEEYTETDQEFRQFIIDITKNNTLGEGLLVSSVIDELTADLIGEKAKLPLPEISDNETEHTFSGTGKVIASLEAMGYKHEEVEEAVDAAVLSPTKTVEENITAVLKILDKDTQ
jgi:hypothetical protein